MSTLRSFLDSHRTQESDWTLTGMSRDDAGKYAVSDEEYEEFLSIVYRHIFGNPRRVSSLLEKHREIGPLLVDLDFRYEMGGPLVRRFTPDMIRDFIAEYIAAMIYFARVEDLTTDILFYDMQKLGPETDKSFHKDGVHIQCPTITTSPKFQYAIRGFLLGRGVIERVFGSTVLANPPEDCYDVAVIHRNNWFLYGACKPNKAQYTVKRVWRLPISEVRAFLEGDPADFTELVDIVKESLVADVVPPDSLELMKTLSIRHGHTDASEFGIRELRRSEWEELMIAWGAGSAKSRNAAAEKTPRNAMDGDEDQLVTAEDAEESRRATSELTKDDIALAYRLMRECVNAERRAGDYVDWVNVAICLKNISNTEESFRSWVEITRRVDPSHKKSSFTESELRVKWNLIRNDGDGRRLTMASLVHWARVDNPDKYRSILSETHTEWILNFGKDTHVNVACFVLRLFEYEFRCSMGAKRGAYEWYQYANGGHSWKHLRTPTELRARLSGRVKNEYVEAGRKAGERSIAANAANNDTERERWDEKRKKLMQIERQLEMVGFKDNVLRESQEKFYDDEFISRLNQNPTLVGVSNGVLDLEYYEDDGRTGRPHVHFRDGLPDDCISFQLGRNDPDMEAIPYIPYDPNSAEQKELMSFFEKVYPDPVLREYVLTLYASCLKGENAEQKFYVNQGVGSNGKSMIQTLMEYTFGDYQTSLQTTVLTRKRPDGGAANPDIITTKCKRYIYMGEPDEGEKLNTSIMKQISGEDRIQARGLFSDQEKFTMMGKIFMSCNDLPPVSSMDNGTWRRIRVIPHMSVFKDPGDASIDPSKNIYEKDFHLKSKLRHWRVAFLSLLVHYYETRYLEHGLREPDMVLTASNKYKEQNDLFAQFFEENFVREDGAVPVKSTEVRSIFRDWKKMLGRSCEIKETQIMERMKQACGNGSTEKEFFGIRVSDDNEMP